MKSKNATFYIIRHGETEWNIKGIIQGHKDSPLTKNGINQAKQMANMFRKIKFAKIFSSDLLRAKRTAEIIALEKNMAIKTSRLLRERLTGEFQGIGYQKMREELKEQLEKRDKLAKEERFKFKIADNIESDEELLSRFITFLRQLAIAHAGKKVLIITHAGVIHSFLIHLGWAEYEELGPGSIANTGYIILESDGTEFFIKKVVGATKQKL
jgi:broad specificity phosphatase PhoE